MAVGKESNYYQRVGDPYVWDFYFYRHGDPTEVKGRDPPPNGSENWLRPKDVPGVG